MKYDTFASKYDSNTSIGAVKVSLKGSSEGADKGKEIAEGIRSVTRHPATVAIIAVTAAQAPPVGAAVAGVMAAGVGVAEGIAALAAPIGSILGGIKIGKKRRRKGEERKGFLGIKIKGKNSKSSETDFKSMSIEQLHAAKANFDKLKKYSPMFGVMSDTVSTELAKRGNVKTPPSSTALSKDQRLAAQQLAEQMHGALSGNKKAQEVLTTLMMLHNKDVVFARAYAALIADGVDNGEAADKAKTEVEQTEIAWRKVNELALTLLKKMPAPTTRGTQKPPSKPKLNDVAKGASAKLIAEANANSGPMKGVLVLDSGKIKPEKKYRNKLDSSREIGGYLVLKNGRVVGGNWKAV